MKKIEIVKKEQDFNNIILNGRKFGNKHYYFFYVENNLQRPRFGVTVGKKLGNAVIRNKYKRKVRALIDKNKNMFQKGFDYIIMVRKACIGLDYKELESKFKEACQEEKK